MDELHGYCSNCEKMHNFTPTDVCFFRSKCVKWVTFSILQDFTYADVVAFTMQKMEYRPLLTVALILLVLVNCPKFSSSQKLPCEKRACSKTKCYQGRGQCNTITYRCCDGAVTDYLQSDQFENMFSNRNSLEAHAKGFWDYHSFITASAEYEPYGFGTTYLNSNFFGTKEVAAFLAHAGTKTSCEYHFIRESLSWETLIWVFVAGSVEYVRAW